MARKKPTTVIEKEEERDANRDPVTGAAGAHPVGVGAGSATGAATGAAIGTVGGPVGAAAGAVVGGVAGGLAGKATAEAVNPTLEDDYWRAHYVGRDYVVRGSAYEVYRPAYRYGWESYTRYRGRKFEDVERELRDGWDGQKKGSTLSWRKAKNAVRDAWQRVERALGDHERAGH
jgi:hypothetical protein